MKILYDSKLLELRNIIERCAKYQKVMLLYDNVGEFDIYEIYESIQDICIFNKHDINNKKESIQDIINNGYRALIFLTNVDAFLTADLDISDFINIFIPLSGSILPYCLKSDYRLKAEANNYILLENAAIDVNILSSIYFNKFLTCFKNLLNMKSNSIDYFDFETQITHSQIMEEINNKASSEKFDFEFEDVKILKNCDIDYASLPIVNYLLIAAISFVINSVKNHNLSIVDIYKAVGDDYKLIDKFYAMASNEMVLSLINLNYHFLSLACEKTKSKILDIIALGVNNDTHIIDELLSKIKNYAKYDNGILGYLYLYNIFSV